MDNKRAKEPSIVAFFYKDMGAHGRDEHFFAISGSCFETKTGIYKYESRARRDQGQRYGNGIGVLGTVKKGPFRAAKNLD